MSLFDEDPLKDHQEARVKPNAERDPAMTPPPEPAPAAEPGQIVCPHCQRRGQVTVARVTRKRGVSGGKATGALLTAGLSLLAVGLSRKERVSRLQCGACGMSWDVT